MFWETGKDDMQEKIKKWTEEGNYNLLFYQGYDLGQVIRQVPWRYSYCVIEESEKVLLQASYRIVCTDNYGWYGQKQIHFYITEKDGRKYCKFVNALPLDTIADKECNAYFNNHVAACETFYVGVFLPEYKKKVLENTTTFELDEEIDSIFERIGSIENDNAFWDLFECKFDVCRLHFDCYDFVNRYVFIADGYCLTKFKPYADLIDYIFRKGEYKDLSSSGIKLVDDLSIAREEMVKEKIRIDDFHNNFYDECY